MRDPDHFDAWYAATRARVLRQAHALGGDAEAARAAVIDAYAAAWRHWHRVGSTADPEGWARRRVAAALPAARPASEGLPGLDGLDGLDATGRHVLVLQHLSAVPMADLAAEAGVSRDAAERSLATAEAGYAAARGIDRSRIAADLAGQVDAVPQTALPSGAALRGLGRTRRRVTVAGAVVGGGLALAAVVTGGVLVVHQLDGPEGTRAGTETMGGGGASDAAATVPSATATAPAGLDPLTLVPVSQATRLGAGSRWRETGTHANGAGAGRYAPCQATRYADPVGSGVLVRTFAQRGADDGRRVTAVQASELSGSVTAARRAYATTLGWYAGCTAPRTTLARTWTVDGVGDQAVLLELRRWGATTQTVTVGVARTGRIVTTTARVVSGPGADRVPAAPAGLARVLGAAVVRLCGEPGARSCSGVPALRAREALPLPGAHGLLDRVDLPRAGDTDGTWSATDPAPATSAPAALACDDTDFSAAPFSTRPGRRGLTRTFVVLRAGLPRSFGLTENAGRLRSAARAAELVQDIRGRFAGCERDDLASTVGVLADTPDLAAWRVRTEVDDATTVEVLTAVVRRGDRVAQLGLVTAPEAPIDRAAFLAVAQRAQERLGALR